MDLFRKDLADFEPYKIPKIARHNLGDNENRLIDWSDLLATASEAITVEDITYYGDNLYDGILADFAAYAGVKPTQVVQGVGSDQLIQTIITTYLLPGEVVVTLMPDFFMYQVFSRIHGAQLAPYFLPKVGDSLLLNAEDLLSFAIEQEAKVIFLSNPNNPASIAFKPEELENLVARFDGLVVIDEAYIEFASVTSMIPLIQRYSNLIVLRTMSKAFGLSGLRLGFAISSEAIARELDMVQAPYSLPNIVGKIGSVALKQKDRMQESVTAILSIRDDFIHFLRLQKDMNVFDSQTNFVTFFAPYSKRIYDLGQDNDIQFKWYPSGPLAGYIRMTIGRKEEMELVKKLIIRAQETD